MIRISLLILVLSTITVIHAQESGTVGIDINTTTTFNGSITEVEEDSIAFNYTIGEIGNEPLDWSTEWTVTEIGVNEYELSDGAGDIIYLTTNGSSNQDVAQILADPAVSPNGSNCTVASNIGNTVSKLYEPKQAQVQNQTNMTDTTSPPDNEEGLLNATSLTPVEASETPEVTEAAESSLDADSSLHPADFIPAVPIAGIFGAVSNMGQRLPETALPYANQVVGEATNTAKGTTPASSEVTEEAVPEMTEAIEEATLEIVESPEEATPEAAKSVEEVSEDVNQSVESVEGSTSGSTADNDDSDIDVVPVNVKYELPGEIAEENDPETNEAISEVISVEETSENAESDLESASEDTVQHIEADEQVESLSESVYEAAATDVGETTEELKSGTNEALNAKKTRAVARSERFSSLRPRSASAKDRN